MNRLVKAGLLLLMSIIGAEVSAMPVGVRLAMQGRAAARQAVPATCSVFFHANGGTGGKTLTVPGGVALGMYMGKVSPKRDGYTFGGWWTARTGGTRILATDVAVGDATYYAHWTAASACVRPVNGSADVAESVALANHYGYAYLADGGEAKMLLAVFGDGKATALVGDDVYQGELPLLVAPDGATLMVVLEGDAVFGFQQ